MSAFIAVLISTLIISTTAQLPECTHGSVRLQGSSFSNQGHVEVCNRGSWGTVCSSFFSNTEASVVCSQLGFSDSGAERIFVGFSRGRHQQPIFLRGVSCNGTEDSIFDCSVQPVGYCNYHDNDVGVRCRAASFGDIRLRGRQSPRSGRVEVFNGSVWGTVCDDFFSSMEATVACRQLFPAASTTNARALLFGGYMRLPDTSPVPIVLDNLFCTGSESKLTDCSHDGIGVHNCRHHEDAGVQCGSAESSLQKLNNEKMEGVTAKQAEVKGESKVYGVQKQVDEQPDHQAVSSLKRNLLLNALEKLLMEE